MENRKHRNALKGHATHVKDRNESCPEAEVGQSKTMKLSTRKKYAPIQNSTLNGRWRKHERLRGKGDEIIGTKPKDPWDRETDKLTKVMQRSGERNNSAKQKGLRGAATSAKGGATALEANAGVSSREQWGRSTERGGV